MTINAVDISMNLGVGRLVHPSNPNAFSDSFDGTNGSALDAGWSTYNGNRASSQLTVTQTGGRFNGAVVGQTGDNTLWANSDEGNFRYRTVTGDFEATAIRLGLENGAGSSSIQQCALMVRAGLNTLEFISAGNRNSVLSTIEKKVIRNGVMSVDDEGTNAITNNRCDMMVERVGSLLTFSFRAANSSDAWVPVNLDVLAGDRMTLTDTLQVGIAVYGKDGCPDFIGTCDDFTII